MQEHMAPTCPTPWQTTHENLLRHVLDLIS